MAGIWRDAKHTRKPKTNPASSGCINHWHKYLCIFVTYFRALLPKNLKWLCCIGFCTGCLLLTINSLPSIALDSSTLPKHDVFECKLHRLSSREVKPVAPCEGRNRRCEDHIGWQAHCTHHHCQMWCAISYTSHVTDVERFLHTAAAMPVLWSRSGRTTGGWRSASETEEGQTCSQHFTTKIIEEMSSPIEVKEVNSSSSDSSDKKKKAKKKDKKKKKKELLHDIWWKHAEMADPAIAKEKCNAVDSVDCFVFASWRTKLGHSTQTRSQAVKPAQGVMIFFFQLYCGPLWTRICQSQRSISKQMSVLTVFD